MGINDDDVDGWQVQKSLKGSSVTESILDLGVLVPDSELTNTKEFSISIAFCFVRHHSKEQCL